MSKIKIFNIVIVSILFVLNVRILWNSGIALDENLTLAAFYADSLNLGTVWMNVGGTFLLAIANYFSFLKHHI